MNSEKRREARQKIKRIRQIGFILIALFLFCLLCPPVTALFDRNDIWVGVMPLSQFYIFLFTGLIVVVLFVLYKFDVKYDNDELEMTAARSNEGAGK
jgi:hypothetical protein